MNSTSAHIHSVSKNFLHDLMPFDWESDLFSTSLVAETCLRRLAGDKRLFRELIEAAVADPYVWSKCEEDLVEDKIVLWDDVERNIRIRLRMSTRRQERLAHNHRFSFTNLVLRGKYVHWVYKPLATFDETTALEDVEEVMLHEDRANDCFTIHHSTLHSTPFIEPHTISLVLRGNPVKERAPVMFKEPREREQFRAQNAQRGGDIEPEIAEKGDMFWRVGENKESAERRNERQMSRDRHAYWCQQLGEYGLI